MALKLIDKDLKSKFAEALLKNEISYGREIDRRFKRIDRDLSRSYHAIDANEQVFLNQTRAKRNKWINDDLKCREQYRITCKNVQLKKFNNLKQLLVKPKKNAPLYEKMQYKMLEDQIMSGEWTGHATPSNQNRKKKVWSHSQPQILKVDETEESTESFGQSITSQTKDETESTKPSQSMSRIPLLPPINTKGKFNFDSDLYSKYNLLDKHFLNTSPAKIEMTVTNVGKSYMNSKKEQHNSFKQQNKRFIRIQENALKDYRFKNLITSLD
jgi:hypothetical protein